MEFFDKNILNDYVLITNAALNRNPSAEVISKFKTYLTGKDSKFKYLHQSYLIYSTLIKTFCSRNDCGPNLVIFNYFYLNLFLIKHSYSGRLDIRIS